MHDSNFVFWPGFALYFFSILAVGAFLTFKAWRYNKDEKRRPNKNTRAIRRREIRAMRKAVKA